MSRRTRRLSKLVLTMQVQIKRLQQEVLKARRTHTVAELAQRLAAVKVQQLEEKLGKMLSSKKMGTPSLG